MSYQRRIDRAQARQDMARDRVAHVAPSANPMFLASLARAKALDARRAALAAPLVVAGRFDRAAIMKAAVAAARLERTRGNPAP